MSRPTLTVALLLGAALPLMAFAAPSALVVDDPYVRLVPPNAPTSAAFMAIANTASAERQLIKAQSPAASTVELHTHVNDDGVMKMRQVQSIEIKAKSQVELKPGSYHIMLIGLKQALKEGDAIPITLTFDDGSVIELRAPVRKIGTPVTADQAHLGMKH